MKNRYGFCTGFATEKLFEISEDLLPSIKEAGFDFVEFPIMSVVDLEQSRFESLVKMISELGLSCDGACNFLPGRFSVYNESQLAEVQSFLKVLFERAKILNVKKIAFGSAGFRNVPDTMTHEDAYKKLVNFIKTTVVPFSEKYGIPVLVEPLNREESNIVNTIVEGAQLVQDVNSKHFGLMVDLFHMMCNNEDPNTLKTLPVPIEHVHLCNVYRTLPVDSFDEYINSCMNILKEMKWSGTISFESRNSDRTAEAVNHIKSFLVKTNGHSNSTEC